MNNKDVMLKTGVFLSIFIGLFLIAGAIHLSVFDYPPRVLFINLNNKQTMAGDVFLDDKMIGSTSGDYFDDLPDDFCEDSHKIELKTGEEVELKWNTYKTDCEVKYINYSIKAKILYKKEPSKFLITKFFVIETEEPLKGELFFDGKLVSSINGVYSLKSEDCPKIGIIRLEYIKDNKKYKAEWSHDTNKCKHGILKYSIPQNKYGVE